jgi:hypothetical protein
VFDPEVLEPANVAGFDDVIRRVLREGESAARETVDSAKESVTSRGGTLVEDLLRSSEFNKVLVKVEEAAKKAVIEETKKNALALGGIAVAAGIVGGTFFKGKVGIAVAAALGAAAVFTLSRASAPAAPAAGKR